MKNHLEDLPTVEEMYGDEQYRNNLQTIRSKLMHAVSDAAKRFKNPQVAVIERPDGYDITIREGGLVDPEFTKRPDEYDRLVRDMTAAELVDWMIKYHKLPVDARHTVLHNLEEQYRYHRLRGRLDRIDPATAGTHIQQLIAEFGEQSPVETLAMISDWIDTGDHMARYGTLGEGL